MMTLYKVCVLLLTYLVLNAYCEVVKTSWFNINDRDKGNDGQDNSNGNGNGDGYGNGNGDGNGNGQNGQGNGDNNDQGGDNKGREGRDRQPVYGTNYRYRREECFEVKYVNYNFPYNSRTKKLIVRDLEECENSCLRDQECQAISYSSDRNTREATNCYLSYESSRDLSTSRLEDRRGFSVFVYTRSRECDDERYRNNRYYDNRYGDDRYYNDRYQVDRYRYRYDTNRDRYESDRYRYDNGRYRYDNDRYRYDNDRYRYRYREDYRDRGDDGYRNTYRYYGNQRPWDGGRYYYIDRVNAGSRSRYGERDNYDDRRWWNYGENNGENYAPHVGYYSRYRECFRFKDAGRFLDMDYNFRSYQARDEEECLHRCYSSRSCQVVAYKSREYGSRDYGNNCQISDLPYNNRPNTQASQARYDMYEKLARCEPGDDRWRPGPPRPGTEGCFKKLRVGAKIRSGSRVNNAYTYRECQETCWKDRSCQAFSYKVSGNSRDYEVCLISTERYVSSRDLIMDGPYDTYVKEQSSFCDGNSGQFTQERSVNGEYCVNRCEENREGRYFFCNLDYENSWEFCCAPGEECRKEGNEYMCYVGLYPKEFKPKKRPCNPRLYRWDDNYYRNWDGYYNTPRDSNYYYTRRYPNRALEAEKDKIVPGSGRQGKSNEALVEEKDTIVPGSGEDGKETREAEEPEAEQT